MSTMTESLAQQRHAARYSNKPAGRGSSAQGSPRTRAGWLLVGLGLRLALPGRQAGTRRVTLLGR